ncbi:MAG: 50S ribosomal protein L9 [Treponema sp.]|nr:50S ribosomal protein L9 [Treponema sp.]
MKVILNKDISPLGEEGDVKEVAKGYARNFLFPRRIALPYTERTVKLFETRKEEIEERKKKKRLDASSIKERLESLELSVTMPAGANGKLYGAVTNQLIMDELAKQDFHIERKRIEIPGNTIKTVGKYKFAIKLYGNTTAELFINVLAQEIKTETKTPPAKDRRRRGGGEAAHEAATENSADAQQSVDTEPADTGEVTGAVRDEAATSTPE